MMRVSTTSEKIRRYTELEYILVGDLRDLLEDPIDDENLRWIRVVVDALLETLPQEFELKCRHGYMREVLDRHPHWSMHVVTLASEHEKLCEWLRQVRQQLDDPREVARLAPQLSQQLFQWMEHFEAHNHREVRLLQTAMNLEVGVGD